MLYHIQYNVFVGFSCECKYGFVRDGYSCRSQRGEEGRKTTQPPGFNAHFGNNQGVNVDGNNSGRGRIEDRAPEVTCVFSVCSCPPGWALHVDSMNNKNCIQALQTQGKQKV